tara:strand:- start:24213 stop:25022 length:810 start_codon:yes stop_codon:yes gene_type:complete
MLGLGTSISSYSVLGGYENLQSLEFDGTGDALDIFAEADLQTLIRGTGLSISFWFKTTYDSTFNLFGYSDTGNVLAGGFECMYQYLNASVDVFSMFIKLGGATGATIQLINPSFTDTNDTWTHLAYVIARGADDSTNGTHTLYINGSQVGTGATKTKNFQEATTVTSGRGLLFGADDSNGVASQHFTGSMDEIAIFSIPIDSDSVAAIYNSGVPFDLTEDNGNYDNSNRLNRYYRFVGSTQSDLSEDRGLNGVSLTMEGNPTASTSVPS